MLGKNSAIKRFKKLQGKYLHTHNLLQVSVSLIEGFLP
jgi:hypothetical protein